MTTVGIIGLGYVGLRGVRAPITVDLRGVTRGKGAPSVVRL